METRILGISGLWVRRDGQDILRGVDWEVLRGQHWVILGPNGCGKTSLLRTLLAYLSPSSGEIEFLGARHGHCDWREQRPHIGLVSSSLQASIPAAETALETVISGRYAQLDLWAKTTAADRRRAHSLLDFLKANHLADRPWTFLSQGERQRVLIARALMAEPALLILDEACAGLDPVAREEFLGFVQGLCEHPESPTLLFVTHHVEEIVPAFTHVLMLRAGEVVAAGPVAREMKKAQLERCLGGTLRLTHRNGRYSLQVGTQPGRPPV
jgi:iron complex transport system ATP-binding protein